MARPCRCAARAFTSLGHHDENELRSKWLGHADARQVSDLPDSHALRLVVCDHGQLFNLARIASAGHQRSETA